MGAGREKREGWEQGERRGREGSREREEGGRGAGREKREGGEQGKRRGKGWEQGREGSREGWMEEGGINQFANSCYIAFPLRKKPYPLLMNFLTKLELTSECCPGVKLLSQFSHRRHWGCQSFPNDVLRSAVKEYGTGRGEGGREREGRKKGREGGKKGGREGERD